MPLNANLREIMIAFNNCLGFTLFNSPRAFLVYLSISSGIAVEQLTFFLKQGSLRVVTDNLQDIFLHGNFVLAGDSAKFVWGGIIFEKTESVNRPDACLSLTLSNMMFPMIQRSY
jgi:hypothetical protein